MSPRLGLALFLLIFVIGGVTVALVTASLERWFPLPRRNPVSLTGYTLLMLVGIAGTVFLTLVVLSPVLGLDI